MLFAAVAAAVLYSQGNVKTPEGIFAKDDGKVCTLAWDGTGKKPVLALDFGAKSVGGYAVFNVTGYDDRAPVLRLSYANHPDGLGETGCFSRETSARYLGPAFDIPVLPGNINRHEIYSIGRTGTFVAPLIQGQERYMRVQLDTPGTVSIDSLEIENAEVFSTEPLRGSFACSDDRLTRLWDVSVHTCRIASFPNHDAWKMVAGRFLPRKLEQASGDGWHRRSAQEDGMLEIEYEFDANPHFPVGAFEVMCGNRRTKVTQCDTNVLHTVKVPVRKGERFGISVEKESWPVIVRAAFGGREIKSLNDWDFARTLPYVADGAKRDRLIWSGDLWWAQRNMYYGFGAQSPYMPGSVKMLAFNRTPEGYVHASPYAERAERPQNGDYGPFGSDEFAAWFIPVAWDHLLYTGDFDTVKAVWPDVVALVGYLNRHRGEDGIFEQRKETCKHAAGLVFGGTSLHHRSFMNILLWKTLKDAAAIADALGHEEEAKKWSADATAFAPMVRKHFWDDANGHFVLSREERKFGFEANALALATGFANESEAARMRAKLVRIGHGKFQALASRGKFEYGDAHGGLKAIEDHNWHKLLDPSWKGALTTTECMGMNTKGWGDESHPDTAIAGILSSYVLGVVPTKPGYAEFAVRPQTANLTWAQGTVPTPYGDIKLRWDCTSKGLEIKLTVPEHTKAVFESGNSKRIFRSGEHMVLMN